MVWDERYKNNNRIWGNGPSELALIAVEYLQKHGLAAKGLDVLDVGCGYGRDAAYISKHLKCSVLGVDNSAEAIRMAQGSYGQESGVAFQCCAWEGMITGEAQYDVIFAASLYHLLERGDRKKFVQVVAKLLKTGGLLFLSTLSPRDPHHYGIGIAVPGEPNSFRAWGYLHFCTRAELLEDFCFMTIRELYEHAYDEPHPGGDTHHHVVWILVGGNGSEM
jgi:2-polyprenyl-3-methyl-5-hydroxy-6-metoxy-1,4-benzoquinol methylase